MLLFVARSYRKMCRIGSRKEERRLMRRLETRPGQNLRQAGIRRTNPLPSALRMNMLPFWYSSWSAGRGDKYDPVSVWRPIRLA